MTESHKILLSELYSFADATLCLSGNFKRISNGDRNILLTDRKIGIHSIEVKVEAEVKEKFGIE